LIGPDCDIEPALDLEHTALCRMQDTTADHLGML